MSNQFLKTDFVAVDIETTGFNAKNDEIISIAAVRIKNLELVGHFNEFIYTSKKIPEHITNLTGITNQNLYDARNVEEVLVDFMEFLGDRTFVAHNAKFDYNFINEKLSKHLNTKMDNKMLCTIRAAKMRFDNLENYKLDTVAKAFNIPNLGHHQALNDACVCADILLGVMGVAPLTVKKGTSLYNPMKQVKQALKNSKAAFKSGRAFSQGKGKP